MRILGELVSLGGISAIAWMVRNVIRDVLDHRWKVAVLRRCSDEQLPDVVRDLSASRAGASRLATRVSKTDKLLGSAQCYC